VLGAGHAPRPVLAGDQPPLHVDGVAVGVAGRRAEHRDHAIGVVSVGHDGEGFSPIIAPETAVPARRTIHINGPKEGGDVLIKVIEGNTHIKVTKPEPKAAKDEKDEDDSDFSEEEEEDKREKVWKSGETLAEAAVRGLKKGSKVEVTVNVAADLGVTITAREVGGKGGVRGNIAAP